MKYAANTFLALKISFANEVAALCEALGAEPRQVLSGVGLDARIGGAFLNPGPGFGGSCLPKDLSGFIAVAASVGQSATLARAIRQVNEDALLAVADKIEFALGSLQGRRIGVLGLAFKPGTDDVRHSPALALIKALLARGAVVRAHDPAAAMPAEVEAEQVGDPYEAARDADAVVVATAWPAYRDLQPARLRQVMQGHVVLDAVDVLDLGALDMAGLGAYGVGRGRACSFVPVLCRPLEWMLQDAKAVLA